MVCDIAFMRATESTSLFVVGFWLQVLCTSGTAEGFVVGGQRSESRHYAAFGTGALRTAAPADTRNSYRFFDACLHKRRSAHREALRHTPRGMRSKHRDGGAAPPDDGKRVEALLQGRDIFDEANESAEKRAWILVTPLDDDVVREVAEEISTLEQPGSGKEPVDQIMTHFAVLLQVGACFYVLERRGGGVTAAGIPPSEVKDRAVDSEARVTACLKEISSLFFEREAAREFALTTNNCRNFAHGFYRAFCGDTAGGGVVDEFDHSTRDVQSFVRWVEPMARKDGF